MRTIHQPYSLVGGGDPDQGFFCLLSPTINEATRRRLWLVERDPDATDVERAEASAQLDEIDAWARKHMRATAGNEQRQVRAVRQAIRRLLENLETARDAHGEPNQVLHSFGAHIVKGNAFRSRA